MAISIRMKTSIANEIGKGTGVNLDMTPVPRLFGTTFALIQINLRRGFSQRMLSA
jgi:hypothetical protein